MHQEGGKTVESLLATDQQAVTLAHETWMKQRTRSVLDRCLDQVEDVSDELARACQSGEKKLLARDREKQMRVVVVQEILRVTEGLMAVTEYSQRAMSRQHIYIYVGTHWELVPIQLYIDFAKEAAQRMGLDQVYACDQDFMNKVMEQVAFCVARHHTWDFPVGEVWINLQNGTLEIDGEGKMVFREHSRQDFFLYCLPYAYDEHAECPRWMKFLDTVMPDASQQQLMSEYIGYCFTRNLRLEKMAVCYGQGSNGKSVLLEIVENLIGKHNVSNVSLSSLTLDDEKRGLIENKLANISHESDKKLDNAMMKQLVSGDPTEVRELYRGTHTMYQYAKFFTSFNKLPPSEHTYGFFRRWLLFPFDVTIPEGQQDPDLSNKLCRELSGILNWVLRGLVTLLHNRQFSSSPICQEALADYRRQSNSAMLFMAERCEVDSTASKQLKELYLAYGQFCYEEGISNKFRKSTFCDILVSCGASVSIFHGYKMLNIRLKTEE